MRARHDRIPLSAMMDFRAAGSVRSMRPLLRAKAGQTRPDLVALRCSGAQGRVTAHSSPAETRRASLRQKVPLIQKSYNKNTNSHTNSLKGFVLVQFQFYSICAAEHLCVTRNTHHGGVGVDQHLETTKSELLQEAQLTRARVFRR